MKKILLSSLLVAILLGPIFFVINYQQHSTNHDVEVVQLALPFEIIITESEMTKIKNYGRGRISEQCFAQPWLAWCDLQVRDSQDLDSETIESESLRIRSFFLYTKDEKDTWRVHEGELNEENLLLGDCDDLTSTTLQELADLGHPLEKMWMLAVSLKPSFLVDHLVGMIEDVDGNFWIVGDTNKKNFYPVSEIKYHIRGIAGMDNAKSWKDPRDLDGVFPTSSLLLLG